MQKIFLYGFCGDIGDAIFPLLRNKYDISYWIGDHDMADSIWAYIRVDSDSICFRSKDISAYNSFYDRCFLKYLVMVQRRGEHWRDFFEIRNEFAILFYHFSAILEQSEAEFIIFSNLPHEGPDYVLYELAKEKGIKTLLFYQSLFPNKFFAVTSMKDFGVFSTISGVNNKSFSLDKPRNLFYMDDIRKVEGAKKVNVIVYNTAKLMLFTKNLINTLGKIHKNWRKRHYSKSIIKNLFTWINNFHFSKNINKSLIQQSEAGKIIASGRFIYVPLHQQPELTTSALGGYYEDQLNLIDKLIEQTDASIHILVKENPKQNSFQRKQLFFKRINFSERVKMVNNVSSLELIEKAIFVATVSGTAGWEALEMGRKCLVFGQAWYKSLPGCYDSKLHTADKIISYENPDPENVNKSLKDLMQKSFDAVIDEEYSILVDDFCHEQNAQDISEIIVDILSNPSNKW